ncbi:predicted protein [Uncinocarpus reesii 1704]|uniref:Calcineurin-like phosphoesterase domain-containing protein n=1 Tax=Uncinocarpus reesii (strain UAMH 1704) TaxID=336963 RepID=C4JLJ1_UNCRE|nr:uncharacterized protein UREG_03699 [Uncinocarpus reesii 1704]EEP78853.1 predicted protein [Uncinocarpus reesii 1704]
MKSNLIITLVTAPRFRRYLIVYLVLLVICWAGWVGFASPQLKEHGQIAKALDVKNRDRVGGWFGTNSLPRFADLVHLETLDEQLLPSEGQDDIPLDRRRLVVVGDVHGCKDELDDLLDKISFDGQTDHLIFAGDLITKGPKSLEVVQLAREYNASCVRGNNEDRILLYHRELLASGVLSVPGPNTKLSSDDAADTGKFQPEILPYGNRKEHLLAQALGDEDAAWLHKCPVILKVGRIGDLGEVVVVHGGLVPGVELESQDPFAVMTMRSLDLDTHVPSSKASGMHWAKIFNKYQSLLASRLASEPSSVDASLPTTVIYGHTPHRSAAIRKYTKGIDTGCVRGGKLTALVLENGGKTRVEHVRCKDYVSERK